MLSPESVHPTEAEVNPEILLPGFRFTRVNPIEGTPGYRYHVGLQSLAVWFSRSRRCWVVRNADIGVKIELPLETTHEQLERIIIDTLVSLQSEVE